MKVGFVASTFPTLQFLWNSFIESFLTIDWRCGGGNFEAQWRSDGGLRNPRGEVILVLTLNGIDIAVCYQSEGNSHYNTTQLFEILQLPENSVLRVRCGLNSGSHADAKGNRFTILRLGDWEVSQKCVFSSCRHNQFIWTILAKCLIPNLIHTTNGQVAIATTTVDSL